VVRRLLPALAGVLVTAVIVSVILAVGRSYGRPPSIPWSCDDTRYVETVPTGRAVVGAAVSAPPSCGS
jgi:hypothetical protein